MSEQEYLQEIVLKGYGKFIDTTPLRNRLTQGESLVDVVFFYLDRYCHYQDLLNFLFVIRGILPSGKQVEAVLAVDNYVSGIVACWKIKKEFTEEAGELLLDLCAYAYQNKEKNTKFLASEKWGASLQRDLVADPPDYVLHYQLPAITIRAIPERILE
ncbi:MAG: hypothetical protein K2G25_11460 [Oscillospiraceae bacterium]|nr:hypothetical protein [Oscillospiraceae bacterium]